MGYHQANLSYDWGVTKESGLLEFKSYSTVNANSANLQNLHITVKKNLFMETPINVEPARCHAMGGNQRSCMQPELTTMLFSYFGLLKRSLQRPTFTSHSDVQERVVLWFRQLPNPFCTAGIC
jgi:hypothetical protein